MNPKYTIMLAFFQCFCRTNIGQNHHLFNQLIRGKLAAQADFCWFAFCIHHNAFFGQIKIKRAALVTGFFQIRKHRYQMMQGASGQGEIRFIH